MLNPSQQEKKISFSWHPIKPRTQNRSFDFNFFQRALCLTVTHTITIQYNSIFMKKANKLKKKQNKIEALPSKV